MAQTKPILYTFYKSSCSWRVRISLAWKGIDYEHRTVDLFKGDQNSDEFRKINPSGEVPVFVDDNKVITNSVAILEYLEETQPHESLLPEDPLERAHVRGIVDKIVSGIQPLQNLKILKYVGDARLSWGTHWVESGLSSLEKVLQQTHGRYCVGDNVTIADLCLLPQVYNATDRFDINIAKYPVICDITKQLELLKPFQVSHPDKQPEYPRLESKQCKDT